MPTHQGGNAVQHPGHYNWHPAGIECQEVVNHFPFPEGNVIKYVWRAGHKGGAEGRVQDLRKAQEYLAAALRLAEDALAADTRAFVTETDLETGKETTWPVPDPIPDPVEWVPPAVYENPTLVTEEGKLRCNWKIPKGPRKGEQCTSALGHGDRSVTGSGTHGGHTFFTDAAGNPE